MVKLGGELVYKALQKTSVSVESSKTIATFDGSGLNTTKPYNLYLMQIVIGGTSYFGFATVNSGGYLSLVEIENSNNVTVTNAIDGRPSDTITVTVAFSSADIQGMYIWKLW